MTYVSKSAKKSPRLQESLGLAAIISASFLWAIAANVASSLFQVGVNSFELVAVTTILATLGLAVIVFFSFSIIALLL